MLPNCLCREVNFSYVGAWHELMMIMDEISACFRLASCEPRSANQNISAYGVMLFVSDTYLLCHF